MSISNPQIKVICDQCNKTLALPGTDTKDKVYREDIKENGWEVIEHEDRDDEHYFYDCLNLRECLKIFEDQRVLG